MSGPQNEKEQATVWNGATLPARGVVGANLAPHTRGVQAAGRVDPFPAVVLRQLARLLVEALLEVVEGEEKLT